MRAAIIVGLLLVCRSGLPAEIYRCTDPEGAVTFSQTRCAVDARRIDLPDLPPTDRETSPETGTRMRPLRRLRGSTGIDRRPNPRIGARSAKGATGCASWPSKPTDGDAKHGENGSPTKRHFAAARNSVAEEASATPVEVATAGSDDCRSRRGLTY
jgi:hypothetical protein